MQIYKGELMNIMPIKYELSFFSDVSDLLPSPERLTKLIEIFSDVPLLPGSTQEISTIQRTPIKRMKMSSETNEWMIHFLRDKVVVLKQLDSKNGENMGTVESFVEEAADYLNRIITLFNLEASRMALITSGMMNAMDEGELNKIYNKIINPLPFFQEHAPFEWNNRQVGSSIMEISGKQENINIISAVNRILGTIESPDGVISFDRIELSFDINTDHKNTKVRFNNNDLIDFKEHAIGLRNDLVNQYEEFFND